MYENNIKITHIIGDTSKKCKYSVLHHYMYWKINRPMVCIISKRCLHEYINSSLRLLCMKQI